MFMMVFGCTKEEPAETQKQEMSTSGTQELTVAEAKDIAREAYVYGFPMVVNYKTMYMYFVNEKSPEYKGPFNYLGCDARVFTPDDKAVVTPNSDTPYCMFWVDLRQEPVVISVPDMEPERFYHFQLIDLYTHNFAYIGTLTTGNGAGKYLIAGPGWKGQTPKGINKVIHCETDFFFVVVRTQLFNPEDIDNVKKIQDAYDLKGLSAYLGQEAPPAAPKIDFPEWKEGEQFNAGAFTYIDFMMSLISPVKEEKELFDRFAKIGLSTDEKFEITNFSPEIAEALAEGVKEGFREMEAFIEKESKDPLGSAKIFGTREFLKESAQKNYNQPNFYIMRAVAANMGLYGNSGAEAIYPTYLVDSEGAPLNASGNNYTLTFKKGELPPVKSFWSLTMYDGKTQLFIHNPLDRYLLNSTMLDQFVKEEDGSMTFYIQKDSPGKDKEANWLPAPDGPFYVVMRLYGPEKTALEGRWTPPKVKKADGSTGVTNSLASDKPAQGKKVTVANFVRAETDHMIRANMKAQGIKIGRLNHSRNFTTPDNQPVIRMNQDTLYSGTLLDLSKPAKITLPEVGGRYMSMQVVNQDHYMFVESKPGTYKLTKDSVGTRFASVIIRTFVDVGDPEDLKKAHAAQDAIKLTGGGDGPFEAPDWNTDDLAVARKALNDFAVLGFDSAYAFGRKEEVRPVDHIIGTAAGWGGLPRSAATYIVAGVEENDGKKPHAVTVKDVPVDAFWSVTVYNADGYLEANDRGVNSYNNLSAKPNEDGSITIHLGGCEDGRMNCIPITPGWNYAIRMYEPRKEILDGTWKFPRIKPVK
jgi:hypothetical protein